ncbi:Zn-dependent hydrolase, partial [Burkholderia cenocepacia]|nr:Zn-dependent hydrolase [Burkholderia cenocepacia]
VTVTGFESHAGTTPMSVRRDGWRTSRPALQQLVADIEAICMERTALRGTRATQSASNTTGAYSAIVCTCTRVRQATVAAGYPYLEMCSGAGHDAVHLSYVAPSAMVFVPCKAGLSHNEAEDADPVHLA